MPYERVVYRRAELYEKVWERPVTEVAKDYGVSNVGLAKVAGIEQRAGSADLVVDGEVRFPDGEPVDFGVAEAQRRRRGNQPALVAHDVLDVLGADVTGAHHLLDRARRQFESIPGASTSGSPGLSSPRHSRRLRHRVRATLCGSTE